MAKSGSRLGPRADVPTKPVGVYSATNGSTSFTTFSIVYQATCCPSRHEVFSILPPDKEDRP